MDRFAAMQAFVVTCDQGSFSGAARALRLSPTMVGKHVDMLEAKLGTKLIHRTTRRLTLTEEGRDYRDRAASILAETAALDQTFGADRARPYGTLRLSVPLSYGVRHIAPIVGEFMRRCPEVVIEADYLDRVVDLVDEGRDVAIRVAASLPDSSSLIARKLRSERLVLCAAPGYLERCGSPTSPRHLSGHACLPYGANASAGSAKWPFAMRASGRARAPIWVSVSGPLSSNNGDALRIAAIAENGIILQPSFIVAEDIASGLLREIVFPDHLATDLNVFAVYPRGRHLSAKVRAFVDFAAQALA